MILLQEQVVLDPLQGLMTVVLLGQPGLEVGHLLARAAGRRGLHEEGHDDAGHAVDEQHETEEEMAAAGDAVRNGSTGKWMMIPDRMSMIMAIRLIQWVTTKIRGWASL